MNMHIKTTADNCHLVVKIISNSHVLAQLTDNDERDGSLTRE
ncbi:MAG TPA: hypothetical protein VK588_10230 [Chitinophagaceae bacterium]|nr:hypothetical protein [Chitinophagaceae bacterium]